MNAEIDGSDARNGHPIRATVFGKKGCDKCAVLRKRVTTCVGRMAQAIEVRYHDVETDEGLVAFCRAEGLNPQRIPALLLEAYHAGEQRYRPIPRPRVSATPLHPLLLPRIIGVQTDYSEQGKGVIPPRMIEAEMATALEQAERIAGGNAD